MLGQPLPVRIYLLIQSLDDISDEELLNSTLGLRDELVDSNAESVELLMSDAEIPSQAKAVDPLTLGTIIVTTAVAGIPNIILLIQNWLLRQKDHRIKAKVGDIELEIPRNASESEVRRVIRLISEAKELDKKFEAHTDASSDGK